VPVFVNCTSLSAGLLSAFFDKTASSTLIYPQFRYNLVIYFEKRVVIDAAAQLRITTRSLLTIGEAARPAPTLFYHADGTAKKFIDQLTGMPGSALIFGIDFFLQIL
jgi:hypothetical protein